MSENKNSKHRLISILTGITAGIANGLFGSGGGMVAVPMLEKSGCEPKKAHATSVAVILPLTIASTVVYITKKQVEISFAAKLIIPGLIGAAAGALIMKKMNGNILKRIFGIAMIVAGIRILMK